MARNGAQDGDDKERPVPTRHRPVVSVQTQHPRPVGRRRRPVRLVALFATVLLLAAACGRADEGAAPGVDPSGTGGANGETAADFGTVTFAYPAQAMTMLPTYAVSQLGFDDEEGFEAELTAARGPAVVSGLLSGDFDFSMSVGSSIGAIVENAPLRVVSVAVDKPLFYLYAQPEITSVEELEGRTIGIHSLGSVMEIALREFLAAHGVDIAKTTLLAIGADQMVGGMRGKSIDAAVFAPPDDQELGEGYTDLGFMGESIPIAASGLATTKKLLDDRPELVEAVVRAHAKAVQHLVDNPEDAIEMMAEFLSITEEEARASYEQSIEHFIPSVKTTSERAQQIVEATVESAGGTASLEVEDVFAPTAIE